MLLLLENFILDNILLLMGSFLELFALSLGLYHNPILAVLSSSWHARTVIPLMKRPFLMFMLAVQHRRHSFVALLVLFIACFFLMSFIYLQDRLSYAYALMLFIPLALIVFNLLYYLLWVCSYLINRLVDVGSTKFNLIFSLNTIELILIYSSIPAKDSLDTSSFVLALINLLTCYLSTMIALNMVLTETLRHTTSFTHKNLWKVALTVLGQFIMELTMFCYIGARHFPDAYSVSISIFDAFYFVVITFGTTGYGDIVPTCVYSKCVSILIIITSITCISIMFSSFLSASVKSSKKK